MNTFSPNTVIESSKVNENFDGLADGSEIQSSAITTAKIADANVTSEKLDLTIAFRATTTQTVNSGSATDITTYTETFDLGADFDHTTGLFTAPVTGYYCFVANMQFDNAQSATGRMDGTIVVNGATAAVDHQSVNSTGSDPVLVLVTGPIAMTAAQTAKVNVVNNSGGNEALTASSFFSGYFLGV